VSIDYNRTNCLQEMVGTLPPSLTADKSFDAVRHAKIARRVTLSQALALASTHRAGNAVMLRRTCSDYARVLPIFRTRGYGCTGTRHSLRPLLSRDNVLASLGRNRAAGIVTLVIARSEATKQSILPLHGYMDCFAEPVIELAESETRWLAMTVRLFENRINPCRPGQASACERDPGPITTGRCCCRSWGHYLCNHKILWLWVPAFARTTAWWTLPLPTLAEINPACPAPSARASAAPWPGRRRRPWQTPGCSFP
jgi:hypothetical protein